MQNRIFVMVLCALLFVAGVQAGPVPEVTYDGPHLLADIPFGISAEVYSKRFAEIFGFVPVLQADDDVVHVATLPANTIVTVLGQPAYVTAYFHDDMLRDIQIDFVTGMDAEPAQIDVQDYEAVLALFADVSSEVVSTYAPFSDAEIWTMRGGENETDFESGQYTLPLQEGMPDISALRTAHEQESSSTALYRVDNLALMLSDGSFEGTNPYSISISLFSAAEELPEDYMEGRQGMYPPEG